MVCGPSRSSLMAEGKDRPGSFDYEGVLVRVKKGPAHVWLSDCVGPRAWTAWEQHVRPPAQRPRATSKTFGPY
jgi:hypothetical protein